MYSHINSSRLTKIQNTENDSISWNHATQIGNYLPIFTNCEQNLKKKQYAALLPENEKTVNEGNLLNEFLQISRLVR